MADRETSKLLFDYGVAAAWLGGSLLIILVMVSFTRGLATSPATPAPDFRKAVQAQARANMQDIKKQVAADAVEQYRIASASGTKMDRCTQAQLVSDAYLQAQDSVQYANWKRTELGDCRAAGLPIR